MFRLILLTVSVLTSSVITAEQSSLERLIEGNDRYINDNLKHPNRTSESRKAVVTSQSPFAIIVSCADSRVAPEIVFDQGIGDLFVVRVAGNVVGPLELDSVEYAALYLNSSVILVLGHENCGAVDAVIQGTTKDIESVAELIEPAVADARKQDPSDLLVAATKANAVRMRDYLRETPVIKKLKSENKIDVFAGYYNLKTGKVEILEN